LLPSPYATSDEYDQHKRKDAADQSGKRVPQDEERKGGCSKDQREAPARPPIRERFQPMRLILTHL
jgi:hypothetical protein